MSALALSLSALSGAAAEVYFSEDFSGDWEKKWFVDEEANKGLQVTEDMRFHSISAKMDKPSTSKGKDLVLQFSAKVENHQYAFCGGGYIKLLPEGLKQETFGGDDPYHIMFGPDLCGYDVSHIHAIFNHKGENLLKTDKVSLEYSDKNEFTHLYTLHIKPDGTYEIFFDLESKAKGKMVDDWAFPKPTIDDPDDKKPSDWVDETEIDDPEDKKPEGYDDIPAQIADPDAKKPEDWDDEDDGEWEAPMIDNPDFKGEWKPKMIDNPDYKGKWEHPMIDNPDYKYNENMYKVCKDGCTHVGFEIWQVETGTLFDDIIVTDSVEEAKEYAEKTFFKKKEGEKKMYDELQEKKKAEMPPPDAMDDDYMGDMGDFGDMDGM